MRILLSAALIATGLTAASAAQAQNAVESRVDRLEHEMRAVQRKVFPEGAGKYFEPQITPQQTQPVQPGTPASGPLINLESRVSALESQISTLTGQIEELQYRVRQLQDAFDAYKKATDARLQAIEGGGAAAPAEGGDAPPGVHGNGYLTAPGSAEGGSSDAAPSRPAVSGARAERVAAVERPNTGDAADDAYIYGYRLWDAKLYPEAEAQLKSVVEKYPDSRRASFAQNLLGRAYLDEGKPSLASIAFYDNYKKMPKGERAPDSLFYLATALIQLKKPADACQVYAELSDVYPEQISLEMQAGIDRGRAEAKCK